MNYTLLLGVYFISTIVAISFEKKLIDLNEPAFFDYDDNDNIFVTNNLYGYNNKYYVQGEYIYSIVNNIKSCLDSCLSWINTFCPINTIAITGFDLKLINETSCECKGQILERKKFQYYPYILKVDNYNEKYYYESDLIKTKTKINFFSELKYSQYLCFEYLSELAKKNMAEALINYEVTCDNIYCECSANLLKSY